MTKKQKIGTIIGTTLGVVGVTTAVVVPVVLLSKKKSNNITITTIISQNIYDSVVNDIPIGKTSLEQLNSPENVNKLKEKISKILNISANDITNIVFTDANEINKANVSITFNDNVKFSLENDNQLFKKDNNTLISIQSFYYGIPTQLITTQIENAFDNAINSYINKHKISELINSVLLDTINKSSNLNTLIDNLNSNLKNENSIVKVVSVLFTVNEASDGLYVSISFDGLVEVNSDGNYILGENANTLNSKNAFSINVLGDATNEYLNMIDIPAICKELANYGSDSQTIVDTLQKNQSIFNRFILNYFPIENKPFTASINLSDKLGEIKLTIYFENSSNFIQINVYPSFGNKIVNKYFIVNGGTLVGLTGEGKQQSTLDLSELNIDTIGDKAFYQCSNLTSITIPNFVKTIGNQAFYNCINLTKIIFDSNSQLNFIDDSAFRSCTSLKSITIPNSVTSIGNNAFNGCNCLSNVTFDVNSKVNKISSFAFQGCDSLRSITLPKSIITINSNAFKDCSNLTTVNFEVESNLQAINTNAFNTFNTTIDLNNCSLINDEIFKIISLNNPNAIFIKNNCTIKPANILNLSIIKPIDPIYNQNTNTLTIPANVTNIIGSIPDSLKSSITNIKFEPNSQLEFIPIKAFYDCSNLTSITIPNSVTSIGNSAFSGCSNLTSITIPNSVTSIEGFAFSNCSRLTSITISNSVTSIGDNAFSSCSNLTSITIPNSVTSIGDNAFSNCSNLTSIVIPSGVTSIGNSAFYGCSNLSNVVFEKNSKFIYNNSSIFYNCPSLKEINLNPCTLMTIEQYSNICSNNPTIKFINDKYDSQIFNLGFDGISGTTLTIPTNTKYLVGRTPSNITSVTFESGSQIKEIPNDAFYYCSNLTSITIPSGVTCIGNGAFSGCRSLTSITIPNSVTSIGNSAFSGCSGLTSITIPNSVTSIGNSAFIGCSGLTSITIPNSITSIGDNVFKSCSNLISIAIPNSITSIGDSTFSGCSNLTSITIPNSITSIGNSAFSGCRSLTSITIPNSVTSIGNSAFYGCSKLSNVNISSGSQLTTISLGAFDDCSSLNVINLSNCISINVIQYTEICSNNPKIRFINSNFDSQVFNLGFDGISGTTLTIPANTKYLVGRAPSNITTVTFESGSQIKEIPNDAFYYCSNLTSITIPSGVTCIGNGAFSGCSNLTSITIPNSVTSIGDSAFSGCSGLTSITIPNGVISIGNSAFANCISLTSIKIPNSVSLINDYTFSNCKKLGGIYIPNSVTSIGKYAFNNCGNLTSITVPKNITALYADSFNNCDSLENIIFEKDSQLKGIDGSFFGTALKTLNLSNCSQISYIQQQSILSNNPNITFTFANSASSTFTQTSVINNRKE